MSNEWYKKEEKGSYFFIKFSFYLVCFLPRFLLMPIIFLVALFYFLISRNERENINKFYENLESKYGVKKQSSFYNFFAFAQSIVDKILVWLGKIQYNDLVIQTPEAINELFYDTNQGRVVIASHFGNIEIAKALSNHRKNLQIGVLVYNENSLNFTRMINEISHNHTHIFKVDTLDITAMLEIQRFVNDGGFICVMGDRVPIWGNKSCKLEFLGQEAFFPQGGFILASLLKCEIWALWCVKDSKKYHVWADFLAKEVKRKNINEYIRKYVDLLETNCKKTPQMWFNFFDVWSKNEKL